MNTFAIIFGIVNLLIVHAEQKVRENKHLWVWYKNNVVFSAKRHDLVRISVPRQRTSR